MGSGKGGACSASTNCCNRGGVTASRSFLACASRSLPSASTTWFFFRKRRLLSPSWRNGWNSTRWRSEEHTSELQSRLHLVCRLLLEKKNTFFQHSISSPHVVHEHGTKIAPNSFLRCL